MCGRNPRGRPSLHGTLFFGVSGCSALLVSGCLKINADYDFQSLDTATRADSTLEQSAQPVTTNQTTDATTTLLPSSTNDASTTASTEDSDTRTTSVSNSTSSATSSEFPVDTNDGEWTPFTISLGPEATRPTPVGYSMQVWVDHSKIVSKGGDPEGKDLAIVYVQGGVGRSLNRWRDPSRPWNHEQTRLWIRSQQPLNPGESQSNVYYLVRGSSVFKPKDDPNQIFLIYDDFQGGSFRSQDWQDLDAAGSSNIVGTSDGISLEVSAPGSQDQRRSLLSVWSQPQTGLLAETRYRVPASVNQPCNHMIPLAFETSSNSRVRQGLGLDFRQWKRALYSTSQDKLVFNNISNAPSNEDGNWHRYALTWLDDKAGIWRDGARIDWVENLNQWVNRPSEEAIQLRLAAHAQSGGCAGEKRSQIEFDWVWLRSYSIPEPQSSF